MTIIAFAIFISAVSAQNPVSDLGSWPDGAVTLFGGLYCALHSMSYYNYDVLQPICLAPLWHKIPGLKDGLRGSGKMGSWFNMLVLGCGENSTIKIREEWDAVIIATPELDRTVPIKEKLVFNAEDSAKVKAVVTVTSSDPDMNVNFEGFNRVTGISFEGLRDKDASNLMRRWHGMKQYSTCRQARMVPDRLANAFENAQRYWTEKMEFAAGTGKGSHTSQGSHSQISVGPARPVNEPLAELSEHYVTIFFPEAPCKPGEVSPNAGVDKTSVILAELAMILAYNNVIIKPLASFASSKPVLVNMGSNSAATLAPTNGAPAPASTSPVQASPKRHRVVNPLLPCLWLWNKGELGLMNNLCITFPSVESFPVTDESFDQHPMKPGNRTRIDVSIDLHPENDYQDWEVDGFNIYNFGNLPWLLETLCSCIVSFFITVASNSTPTLSAAIALHFSIPYSCDNNYRDMGWPPSWNDRLRLRWGNPDPAQGYACGIFSGSFKKRMGRTGTSVTRATLLLIVCGLSWAWKPELRKALGFQNSGVSPWVQVAGAALETFVTISATFSFPVLVAWKMNKHALICVAGCLFAVANTVLMWLWIYRGIGLLPLRILGELGAMVLFSVFSAAQLVGIGYVNGATTLFVVYAWFHYVAISCVLGDSRS
ncbi:hypothetical protein TWF694_004596 [Orbilia ellipsospora]|uniref:Uncharacterized protein n=1 Tax=Orbilia ellipsospora TaxID=2528407 RepID=A0AAV9WWR6_9PEZI